MLSKIASEIKEKYSNRLSSKAMTIKTAFVGNLISHGLGGAALGAGIGAFKEPNINPFTGQGTSRWDNITKGALYGAGIGAGAGALRGLSKYLPQATQTQPGLLGYGMKAMGGALSAPFKALDMINTAGGKAVRGIGNAARKGVNAVNWDFFNPFINPMPSFSADLATIPSNLI